MEKIMHAFSAVRDGVTGWTNYYNAGKISEKEEVPESSKDGLDISFPAKTVREESTEGLLQNTGVIATSKEVREKSVPDLKPGEMAEQTAVKADRIVSREVTLKSGVTIHEDPEKHQVTISRNDGSGNPLTMAVLDDTSLFLPVDTASKGAYGRTVQHSLSGLFENTAADRSDVVIKNSNMAQIIKSDGTIVIEDQKHGIIDTPQTLFPAAGYMSIFGKWNGDRYTITPEGALNAQYFARQTGLTMSGPAMGLAIAFALGASQKPSGMESRQMQASLNQDGTITGHRPDASFKNQSGETVVHLKPFVSHDQVNDSGFKLVKTADGDTLRVKKDDPFWKDAPGPDAP